jgi:hypothetical protein
MLSFYAELILQQRGIAAGQNDLSHVGDGGFAGAVFSEDRPRDLRRKLRQQAGLGYFTG